MLWVLAKLVFGTVVAVFHAFPVASVPMGPYALVVEAGVSGGT